MGQGSAKNCCGKGSRQKVIKVKHIGGEGSQQNFRKSDGGVNIKIIVTSFLDGPLLRPRLKNGGFQLVIYKTNGCRNYKDYCGG